MKNRLMSTWLVFLPLLAGLSACKTDEVFEELGGNLAGPTDVASFGQYFYVLNSDFDRRFNKGSILILDPEANDGQEKVAVIEVPRLGRSLFVDQSNALMLASFDRSTENGKGLLELRQISVDGLQLSLVKRWEVDCSPMNAILSPSGSYIALSCLGGDLWVGEVNTQNFGASTLQRVRDYEFTRRALYIYESGDTALLLAFPTDVADQNISDVNLIDEKSFDSSLTPADNGDYEDLNEGPNEVPDTLEDNLTDIRRPSSRYPYQFVAYNLSTEKERGFPFVELGTIIEPSQANRELLYIYYTLKTEEGKYESGEQPSQGKFKYYRTNFWSAVPDPDDASSFFLSQRSPANDLLIGNDVVRVSINTTKIGDNPEKLRPSSELLSYERVYGYIRDNPSLLNYPGDIEVFYKGGQKVLAINHFRDAVYWSPGQQIFGVATISLDEQERNPGTRPVTAPITSVNFSQSYYQLAVNNQGVIMSCSFYGDSVLILDVGPQADISLRKQIY